LQQTLPGKIGNFEMIDLTVWPAHRLLSQLQLTSGASAPQRFVLHAIHEHQPRRFFFFAFFPKAGFASDALASGGCPA